MKDPQPAPLYEFKASLGKAMFETLVMMGGSFVLIVGGAIAFQTFIGLEVLIDILEPLGLDLMENLDTIKTGFFIACGFGFLLVMLASFFKYANIKVRIYEDHLTATSISALIFTKSDDIVLSNINSVIADTKGLFHGKEGGGTITIQLANMKQKEIIIEHVHACTQVQQYLVRMLQRYKVQSLGQNLDSQRQQDVISKMQNTLDESGIV